VEHDASPLKVRYKLGMRPGLPPLIHDHAVIAGSYRVTFRWRI
jgi:hypothetical protein